MSKPYELCGLCFSFRFLLSSYFFNFIEVLSGDGFILSGIVTSGIDILALFESCGDFEDFVGELLILFLFKFKFIAETVELSLFDAVNFTLVELY